MSRKRLALRTNPEPHVRLPRQDVPAGGRAQRQVAGPCRRVPGDAVQSEPHAGRSAHLEQEMLAFRAETGEP